VHARKYVTALSEQNPRVEKSLPIDIRKLLQGMKREKVTRATMQPLKIQRAKDWLLSTWWYVDGELTVRVKRVKLQTTVVVKVKVPTAMVQQLN
jgi:hypothetical protein